MDCANIQIVNSDSEVEVTQRTSTRVRREEPWNEWQARARWRVDPSSRVARQIKDAQTIQLRGVSTHMLPDDHIICAG